MQIFLALVLASAVIYGEAQQTIRMTDIDFNFTTDEPPFISHSRQYEYAVGRAEGVGGLLGLSEGDVMHRVEESGRGYRWNSEVRQFFAANLVPEMCYLKPGNFSVYNSFFLDKHCLKALHEDGECRDFKCKAVRHVLEHGADAYMAVLTADTIEEGVRALERYLVDSFMADVGFCSCGRRFLKTLIGRCLPRYNSANAINAMDLYEHDYRSLLLLQNNLDFKAAARLFDELVEGVCQETEEGICLNNILSMGMSMWAIVNETINNFEQWDEGSQRERSRMEKQCDNMFGGIRAFQKTETYYDDDDYLVSFESWEGLLEKTAAAAGKFFCNKKCRKDRADVYPCCVRDILQNKRILDTAAALFEDVFVLFPLLSDDVFYEISGIEFKYDDDKSIDYMNWVLPKELRDQVMKTLHPARYCDDVTIRCGM